MHYPQHVGIIPDGNRTRAAEQGLPKMQGHMTGFDNGIHLIKYTFSKTPIQALTLRGLSTENTKNRPADELSYLFEIYKRITDELSDFLKEQRVNLRWIGKADGLTDDFVEFMQTQQEEISFPESERTLCIAINYGGRDEIIRGIEAWQADPDHLPLSEEVLGSYLDFGDLPPVDLIIRTKGDVATRLSGFMLWRAGYAELYFSSSKFPTFDIQALQKALERFDGQVAHRNFGK